MNNSFCFITTPLPSLRRNRRRPAQPVCAISSPTPDTEPDTSIQTPYHWTLPIPVVGFVIDQLVFNNRQDKLLQKYGPFYRTNFASYTNSLIVGEYESIRAVCRDFTTFRSRDAWPYTIRTIFGENIFFNIDPPEHSAARRKVAPLFTTTALNRAMFSRIPMVRQLWKDIHLAGVEKQSKVDIRPFIRLHQIKAALALFIDPSTISEEQFNEKSDLFQTIVNGLLAPKFSPQAQMAVRAKAPLFKLTTKFVREHAKNDSATIQEIMGHENVVDGDFTDLSPALREKVKAGEISLLSVLCAFFNIGLNPNEADDDESIEDFVTQLFIIWVGAATTTNSPVSNAVIEIAKDRKLLAKLKQEQMDAMERAGERNQDEYLAKCVCSAKSKLPLLASFTEEIFRFHPPGAAMFRRAAEDTDIKGHKVNKGDLIVLDVFGAQRQEWHYENADEFQADRFLPRNDGKKPEPLVAFGVPGTPHLCIGHLLARYALNLTISILLREYDFEVDPEVFKGHYVVIPEPGPAAGVKMSLTAKHKN